ncbi:MAG: helix-turn-helix transcriptional regulator [Candidatus Omnitrophica bacterium]|nr:helix-turn-helix transcriptional regulator [Candidatus Omnitrophota bacterium]
MALGRKIRELRQQKEWSLAELSKRSGVALSSLSRIETGRMTGTLESHIQIAKAMGVRLPELYAGLDAGGPILERRSKDAGGDKVQAGKGGTLSPLTGASLQKKMLAVLLTLGPRQTSRRDRGPAGGEEFLYVLKGQLDLTVSREKTRLSAGDSAYYQTSLPHQLTNPGGGTAQALRVSSPPTL